MSQLLLKYKISDLSVIYYATNIFQSLGLTGGTTALLATGVTGVVFLVSTVPAMVCYVSNVIEWQLTFEVDH